MKWSKTKPTKPGIYRIRWSGVPGIEFATAFVERRGSGLSVFCEYFHDRIPMSKLGDNDVEWLVVIDVSG